jgi:hypothetical protein
MIQFRRFSFLMATFLVFGIIFAGSSVVLAARGPQFLAGACSKLFSENMPTEWYDTEFDGKRAAIASAEQASPRAAKRKLRYDKFPIGESLPGFERGEIYSSRDWAQDLATWNSLSEPAKLNVVRYIIRHLNKPKRGGDDGGSAVTKETAIEPASESVRDIKNGLKNEDIGGFSASQVPRTGADWVLEATRLEMTHEFFESFQSSASLLASFEIETEKGLYIRSLIEFLPMLSIQRNQKSPNF